MKDNRNKFVLAHSHTSPYIPDDQNCFADGQKAVQSQLNQIFHTLFDWSIFHKIECIGVIVHPEILCLTQIYPQFWKAPHGPRFLNQIAQETLEIVRCSFNPQL